MRISDWSSDVCSSDLRSVRSLWSGRRAVGREEVGSRSRLRWGCATWHTISGSSRGSVSRRDRRENGPIEVGRSLLPTAARSEEHTSELQSLMRISYAVFCLQNKNQSTTSTYISEHKQNY